MLSQFARWHPQESLFCCITSQVADLHTIVHGKHVELILATRDRALLLCVSVTLQLQQLHFREALQAICEYSAKNVVEFLLSHCMH